MPGEEWSDREIDRGAALDREVDRLRGVYRDHAETLSRLAASSPSKQLARRYQELIAEINKAIVGLDEVDPDVIARRSAERPIVTSDPVIPEPTPPPPREPAPDQRRQAPPERPILSSYTVAAPEPEADDGTVLRVALIIGLAIVILGVLALFVWKFSGDRPPAGKPEPETTATASPGATPADDEPVTPAPEPKPESLLGVAPQQQDFGVIAKGTSAVRTFELSNRGKSALTLDISRSKCRCLWYDPPRELPAGGRGTLTVRVDGSRAPAGPLAESIEITAKGEPRAVVVVEITADVK